MGIDLLNQRQTNNPLSALFLFSDGVDTQKHDYFRLMHHFPSNTPCHTFGFGLHHQTDLLIKLAQFSHGGTFTYIVIIPFKSFEHSSSSSFVRIHPQR